MCSNVSDRNGVVMSCFADGVGLEMTTEQARMVVSGGQELETKFAPDIPIKIAFVVESKNENRLYICMLTVFATAHSSTRPPPRSCR